MTWQRATPPVKSAGETAKPRRRARSPRAWDGLPPAENRQNYQNSRMGLRATRRRSAGTEEEKELGHGSQSSTTSIDLVTAPLKTAAGDVLELGTGLPLAATPAPRTAELAS